MRSRTFAVWLAAAVVVLAFGLPLFTALGATDLTGDEPIYAFAVDRMLDQGDWLTPKSIPDDNAPFLEKPPLKFWLVAGSMRAGLLPRNEFGYRVWDAIFGAAAFLYVFAIGVRVSGIVCGLTAVLVLFGHEPLLLSHGLRSNNMEAPLVLSYCAGMFHALAWADAGAHKPRWLHALLVSVWFAFGFMMKFVAAAFLPATLVVMAVTSRRWRRRAIEDRAIWATAIGTAALLILPWFLYQFHLRGGDFWAIIFGQHVVVRFTASLDPSHLQPWYFYVASMAHEFWGEHDLILVSAGLVLLGYRAILCGSDSATLMLVWFVLPLIVISAGTSKLYHYVYPFLPPLAIGAGLIPMAAFRAAQTHRDEMTRAVERVWPSSIAARLPRWLRFSLLALATVAIGLAILTPIVGSIGVHIGGATIFRSSTISRPLFVGTLLLIALGFFRFVPMVFVTVLVIALLPFDAYRNVRAAEVARAMHDDSPLRTLRTCLLQMQAQGARKGVYAYVSENSTQWKYVYYLRGPGWQTDGAFDARKVAAHLLDPSANLPVFMTASAFEDVRASVTTDARRLDAVQSVAFDDGWMLLLPGSYGACAHVTRAFVRDHTGRR